MPVSAKPPATATQPQPHSHSHPFPSFPSFPTTHPHTLHPTHSDKSQLDQHLYLTALKSAKVVGMTSTALARHAALASALAPEVVIVEEAAELLESSLLIALGPRTKHLVLVGDRQQLRPRTAVTRLVKQFRMPVCVCVCMQHKPSQASSTAKPSTATHHPFPPLHTTHR